MYQRILNNERPLVLSRMLSLAYRDRQRASPGEFRRSILSTPVILNREIIYTREKSNLCSIRKISLVLPNEISSGTKALLDPMAYVYSLYSRALRVDTPRDPPASARAIAPIGRG